jgi:lipid-A-disaccharide synthase
MTPPSILISSGDPSGAMHAARLARELRERTGAELFGLGTPEMRDAGVELIGETSEIAVVGLSEALELLPRAWRLLKRLEAEAGRRRPRVAILVDSPDFNLRLGRRLKRLGIPIVYFISPQIWAWRSGRVKQIRDLVAKMLVIFPFEEQFYRDAGVPVEFVGHPLVETVRPQQSREEFCRRWFLLKSKPILALLPGSRRKEIAHNLPGMLEAASIVASTSKVDHQRVLAAAPGLTTADFGHYLTADLPVRVVEGATWDALSAADCAIVASGTSTVETALLGTPMVVVYRVSAASAMVLRRMLHTPYFSMVNLLLGRRAVPELVQDDFTPERVAGEARRLLESPEARDIMRRDLEEVRLRLASPHLGGPISRSAEIIASML